MSCNTSVDSSLPSTSGTYPIGDNTARKYMTAKLVASEDYTICGLIIRGYKVGNGQDLTAFIYSDSGGLPGAQVGAGSNTVTKSTIGKSEEDINFVNMSASLTNGNTYWIVIVASSTNGSHYINWAYGGGYAACCVSRSPDGSSWVCYANYPAKWMTYKESGGTTKTVSDSGQGTDALPGIGVSLSLGDAGSGVDLVSQIRASLSVSDSGQGVESIVLNISVLISDAGGGSESVSVLQEILRTVAEYAQGSDAVPSVSVSFAISDTGQGVDLVGAMSAALRVADSSHGLDVVIRYTGEDHKNVIVTFTAKGLWIAFKGKGPRADFSGKGPYITFN